ncbi:MAG: histidine phosphatase family protein [Clostridia bacterium]|nr:histidine phosphatase family protein [Clostridia bacterium]
MAVFCFVRHGKTDYSARNTKVYQGFGVQLSPMTEQGEAEIRRAAEDSVLQGAALILTSPYTRAVQTAAVLAEKIQVPVRIETDLHEWLAHKGYRYLPEETADAAFRAYMENDGMYPDGTEQDWEDREAIRRRVMRVLEKYREYDKVIVAGHGMMIQAVCGGEILPNGGIAVFRMQ